jgi:hypothetical protein
VAVHCSQYADPDGGGPCLIYQLHDISVAPAWLRAGCKHIAFHDGLTDLANRRFFEQRLAVAVERCRRDPGYAAVRGGATSTWTASSSSTTASATWRRRRPAA